MRYRSNRCAVQPAPSGCWKLTHPLHCLIPLNTLKGFWAGNGQVSVCAQALLQLLRCTACMAAARVATMLCLLLVYVPCNDLCCILPTHSTSTFGPPTVPLCHTAPWTAVLLVSRPHERLLIWLRAALLTLRGSSDFGAETLKLEAGGR